MHLFNALNNKLRLVLSLLFLPVLNRCFLEREMI